jgi:hypothetical protein
LKGGFFLYIRSSYYNNLLRKNIDELGYRTQQLSTGKRINKASDDTAGLQISTRLTAQAKGTDIPKIFLVLKNHNVLNSHN